MRQAARVDDLHICFKTTNKKLHIGGPILPPCERTVLVDGRAHARATDKAQCNGPKDTIVTGSASVMVGEKPAARVLEKLAHGGFILPPCSPNTYIGGPSTGVVVGNVRKSKKACNDLAGGRFDGLTHQSYGNCGYESARQIINTTTKFNLGEDEIIKAAVDNELRYFFKLPAEGEMWFVEDYCGMADFLELKEVLGHYGVESVLVDQGNIDAILGAVADGKGVVTAHHSGVLWNDMSQKGQHAINVTGVKYGADGNPEKVIINDTGRTKMNGCGMEVSYETFTKSLVGSEDACITKKSVW